MSKTIMSGIVFSIWQDPPAPLTEFFQKETEFNKDYFTNIFLRISLISNIGGLLGLCLGSSMISLTEILWFCLIPFLRIAKR